MWKKIWDWLSGFEPMEVELPKKEPKVKAKSATKKPAAKKATTKTTAKKPVKKAVTSAKAKATVKKTATKKPSLPSVKTADLTAMTKKAMDEYAEGLGIKLDRRKTKAAIIEQLKTHKDKIKVS